MKVSHAIQVAPVEHERWKYLPSQIGLLMRWEHAQGKHVRFFALDGEGEKASREGLKRSISSFLAELGVVDPHGGKYTSHSLRIYSHTEKVLLGITLEERLERFGLD